MGVRFSPPLPDEIETALPFFLVIIKYVCYTFGEGCVRVEQICDKLVRDKIPEIIISHGEQPIYRVLNDSEFWEYLLKKDSEELEEVRTASTIKERKMELADKLEIIIAMAQYCGFDLQDILDEANIKKEKNGGFQKRFLLEKVIKNKD